MLLSEYGEEMKVVTSLKNYSLTIGKNLIIERHRYSDIHIRLEKYLFLKIGGVRLAWE